MVRIKRFNFKAEVEREKRKHDRTVVEKETFWFSYTGEELEVIKNKVLDEIENTEWELKDLEHTETVEVKKR